MKKIYLSLAVIAILAGYFAKSDFWFEDEKDVYFPITREQLIVNRVASADRLDFSRNQKNSFEMLKTRLASPYPERTAAYSKAYDREVKARLQLLLAARDLWSNPKTELLVDSGAIRSFFADLAKSKSENIMIRRQAYKNWLAFQKIVPAEEKVRLATLASHSDEELIQSLASTVH